MKTGGGLVVLQQMLYESESVLQETLAAFPEIIAGPSTIGGRQAGLLLVRREMGVGTSEDASGMLSLDHLFIDASGVPVLVEVKRSTDTRVRREVIGQTLDYEANGVRYWPIELLLQSLERTAADAGRSSDELIAALAAGLETGEFWRTVEANLAAGRIRMLIVADSLPAELVRIIEFLNEQMSPAEILGGEVRQFRRTDGAAASRSSTCRKSLGTRLWRSRARPEPRAGSGTANPSWKPPQTAALMRSTGWPAVCDHAAKLVWGKGATPGVTAWYQFGDQICPVWYLNANDERPTSRAYVQLYLADIVKRAGAERASRLLETGPRLKDKIAEARANEWRKYPSLYLGDATQSDQHPEALFAALSSLTGSG